MDKIVKNCYDKLFINQIKKQELYQNFELNIKGNSGSAQLEYRLHWKIQNAVD